MALKIKVPFGSDIYCVTCTTGSVLLAPPHFHRPILFSCFAFAPTVDRVVREQEENCVIWLI